MIRNTQTIILSLFLAPLFLSCGNKQQNHENIETQQLADTILTDDEVIQYFETFKDLLLKGDIEELASMVSFPVEGDYSWRQENEEESVLQFNPYRKKKDFIENYSQLFGEDMVSLLEKVDFKDALQKDYLVTMKKGANTELSFFIDYINWLEPVEDQRPMRVSFAIGYDETNCDVCEHATIYHFQKVDGEIKLTAIQFAG